MTAEQQQQCNEWLLGNSIGGNVGTGGGSAVSSNSWQIPKTKVIVQNDLKKTPYHPYHRYKVLSAAATAAAMASLSSCGGGGGNNISNCMISSSYNTATDASTSSTATISAVSVSAAGVNLNTLANVTALNVATNDGGVGNVPASVAASATSVTNLLTTPHCNSVVGLSQSTVVVQEPAQVRPMES